MPGIASPLWKRLARLPSAGQRQFTPLTARAGPLATGGTGAGGGKAAGAGVGRPATGTTVVVVAATAGGVGNPGFGNCADDAGAGCADVPMGADAAGAGVTVSNTGAAATAGAVTACGGVTGAADGVPTTWAMAGLPDGDSVSRCPGQIV